MGQKDWKSQRPGLPEAKPCLLGMAGALRSWTPSASVLACNNQASENSCMGREGTHKALLFHLLVLWRLAGAKVINSLYQLWAIGSWCLGEGESVFFRGPTSMYIWVILIRLGGIFFFWKKNMLNWKKDMGCLEGVGVGREGRDDQEAL